MHCSAYTTGTSVETDKIRFVCRIESLNVIFIITINWISVIIQNSLPISKLESNSNMNESISNSVWILKTQSLFMFGSSCSKDKVSFMFIRLRIKHERTRKNMNNIWFSEQLYWKFQYKNIFYTLLRLTVPEPFLHLIQKTFRI